MTTELLARTNQSQRIFLSAISSAYRNSLRLYEPSVWLAQEPEIEDKMLRDADVVHATSQRCKLIAGRQWTLQAESSGNEKSALAVAIGTKLLKNIRDFTQSRSKLARAFLHGQQMAWINWRPTVMTIGDGKPRTWIVPIKMQSIDKRWFQDKPIEEPDGTISIKHQRYDLKLRDFVFESPEESLCMVRHTYEDEQGTLGFGRGLREPLAWLWYTKTHSWQEYMNAAERFGQGVAVTKVDGLRDASTMLPNEDLVRKHLETISNMRARHSLVFDKSDEFEIVQPSGEGWQMFRELTESLKSSIIMLILSANLPTSANEGGSYALGEIQENSTEALVQYDREALEETLTHSLVRSVWHYNSANLIELGIADELPRFNIKQEKRLDPEKRAAVAQILHTMGVPLAMEDVYEQTGFRKPEDGEDTLEGADPAEASGFSGGGGGGDPLDFLRIKGPPKPPQPPGQDDHDGAPPKDEPSPKNRIRGMV